METPQERASRKYKEKVRKEGRLKQLCIQFIMPNNQEMWDWICSKGDKAGYIKSLVRKDMENGR